MCYGLDEGPAVISYRWRKARTEHRCCACRETIPPGHSYHYTSGIWDMGPDSFKHCARCWEIFKLVVDRADGDSVALRLDCGTPWRDVFDPDAEPVHLAFMTPEEAQALAGQGDNW